MDYKNKVQLEKEVSLNRKSLPTSYTSPRVETDDNLNINERFMYIRQKIDRIQKLLATVKKL